MENLPENRKEAEQRFKQLDEKLIYILETLGEDFENVAIVARKVWIENESDSPSDSFAKIYFSSKGDPYVIKTMLDVVNKEIGDDLTGDMYAL